MGVGANVGIYSVYAAKVRECKVYAFEPSVFNLEILARNIHLNELVEQVTIVPLPLSNRLQKSKLNMSTTDWGGALSTFGGLLQKLATVWSWACCIQRRYPLSIRSLCAAI